MKKHRTGPWCVLLLAVTPPGFAVLVQDESALPPGMRGTTVPVPAFKPLTVAAPAETPEKSRVLLNETIWEIPDTYRIEGGSFWTNNNWEQTLIVQEAILAGRDAGNVEAWAQFFDMPGDALERFEGVIQQPDGTVIPLDPLTHLIHKISFDAGDENSRKSGLRDDFSRMLNRAKLLQLVIPLITPGSIIHYRAVAHSAFTGSWNHVYADRDFPVERYRLRVRSNRMLYRKEPRFARGQQHRTLARVAPFEPRGSHEHWWADIYLLADGSNLRVTRRSDFGDMREIEVMAENLPATRDEFLTPPELFTRPAVVVYYSAIAPAKNLDLWLVEIPRRFRRTFAAFRKHAPDTPAPELSALLADRPAGRAQTDQMARWIRDHYRETGVPDKPPTWRDLRAEFRGPWWGAFFYFIAEARLAGLQAELALAFPRHSLPMTPEVADDSYYDDPSLMVRIETPEGPVYYAPRGRDNPAARPYPQYCGGPAIVFWEDTPARFEHVTCDSDQGHFRRIALDGRPGPDQTRAWELVGEYGGWSGYAIRQLAREAKRVAPASPAKPAAPPAAAGADAAPIPAAASAPDAAAAPAATPDPVPVVAETSASVFQTKLCNYLAGRLDWECSVASATDSPDGDPLVTLTASLTEKGVNPGYFRALVDDGGAFPFFTPADRRSPVYNAIPETYRVDFALALPEGKKPMLPSVDRRISGPGGYLFTAHAEWLDGKWIGHWILREPDVEVPVADYPALREAELKVFFALDEEMPMIDLKAAPRSVAPPAKPPLAPPRTRRARPSR